jgi:hypothetical protein
MATAVAGASLMGNGNATSRVLSAATRFAGWIMPPHRRDWAEAMLNEVAYVETRRAAWFWILGCVLSAMRERAAYELTAPVNSRGTLKLLLRLGAAAFVALVGVYAVQKPYQRERIFMAVFHSDQASAMRAAMRHARAVQ